MEKRETALRLRLDECTILTDQLEPDVFYMKDQIRGNSVPCPKRIFFACTPVEHVTGRTFDFTTTHVNYGQPVMQ